MSNNLVAKLSVAQGERGKSLEFTWQGTSLGVRVEGDTEYQFVDLGIEGGSGKEVQLQVGNGYIQWKYVDEEEWNNLISISELKGDRGLDGKSAYDLWLENGNEGTVEEFLLSLKGEDGEQGLPGRDGADGKDGITPNITIGTVTTLEPGQQATVTRRGDNENPIFDFGIPKGQDGTGGIAETDMVDYMGKQHDTLKETNDANVEYLLRKVNTQHYEGSSIIATNTYAKQVNNVILKAVTKYKDLGTGELIDSYEEGRNLELVSSKNPIITIVGKNIFDMDWIEANYISSSTGLETVDSNSSRSKMIKVLPSTTYTISSTKDLHMTNSNIYEYDKNGNFIKRTTDATRTFTTSDTTEYIRLGFYRISVDSWVSDTIQIEYGANATYYESYKKDTLLISGEYRSLNDVYDYIDLETGIYVKNIDIRPYQEGDESNDQVVTDMKNTIYKLEEPIISQIDLQGQKVYSYDGTTHYSCQSEVGYPSPILSLDVPTDLASLVSSQQSEIQTLNKENKELQETNKTQDELINISLLATDEMFMMLEPLLVQNYSIGGNSKMVEMYVAMVQRGLKTIEDVPTRYREQVIEILNKLED